MNHSSSDNMSHQHTSNLKVHRDVLLNKLYDLFIEYTCEKVSYETFVQRGNKLLAEYDDTIQLPGVPLNIRHQLSTLLNEVPFNNYQLNHVQTLALNAGIKFNYAKKFHVEVADTKEINFINLDDTPEIDF